MFQPKVLFAAFVWLSLSLTAFGQANYVVELSGTAGGQFYPYVESTGPLSQVSSTAAGPGGTFEIVSRLDGQQFFLIGNTSPFIQYTGPAFNQPQAISGINDAPSCNGSFPANSCAVAITPSGQYLLVGGTSNFYVINTATDSVNFELPLPAGGSQAVGIVVSRDSTFAYVVTSSGVVGQYNLSTKQAVATLPLSGGVSGISLSPLGLLYVTAVNAIYEINPSNLTLTSNGVTGAYSNGEISVSFRPGPLRFTSDGTVAYSASSNAAFGGALMKLTLASYTVATSYNINNPNNLPQFSDVYVASSSQVYAVSPSTGTVWDVNTTNSTTGCTTENPQCLIAVQDATLPANATQNVISAAISNEIPAAQYLFLLTGGSSATISQINLSNYSIVSQIQAPLSSGALQWTTVPPETGAATFVISNASQTLQSDVVSLPLIARVLTSTGQPIYNEAVTFSTAAGGPTITTPVQSTTLDGYVSTTVTAPNPPGIYTVTLTAGTAAVNFTITVPGNGITGGGGGTGTTTGASSQVSIASGDGQELAELTETSPINPLTVLVTDTTGKPLANVAVTFTITSGDGTIDNPNATTNAAGYASTDYTAGSVDVTGDFSATTVNANTIYGSVNFTMTTVHNEANGTGAPSYQMIAPTAASNFTINLVQGVPLANAIEVQWIAEDIPSGDAGDAIPGIGIETASTQTQALSPAGTGYVAPVAACQGSTLSDQFGVSHCTLVTTCQGGTGTFQLLVVAGGGPTLPNSSGLTVNITAGSPLVAATGGNNQTGSTGQALPIALQATVTSACNSPISGQTVTWGVTQGSATLSSVVNTSNAAGQVSAKVTLGPTAGTVQVTVTLGSSTAVFTLTNQAPASATIGSVTATSGNAQSAMVGQSFAQPVTFTVNNTLGSPISGTAVSFSVSSGGATLSASSGTTNAQGQVSTSVTAGPNAGSIVITATAGTVSGTATLTSTAAPPPPAITPSSFANAASGAVGLVQCGLSTVTGNGIASAVTGIILANSDVGPLPYTLGGFSMTIDGLSAPIQSISNQNGVQQVNFQTPCAAPVGSATVVIQAGGVTTTITGVQVNQAQPGIFYYLGTNGKQYGAVISAADGSYVTSTNYAVRGGTYYLVVTGLGQATPTLVTNDTGLGQNVTAPMVVGVSNAGVPVTSTQYAPDLVGVYIVTFQIPMTNATGADQNLAVAISINGQLVFGNGVLLAGVQ